MQHSSAASFASLSAISLPCTPICDLTLSRIVSPPDCARFMISCPIASSSSLWHSSTVDDGDLRCMPTFCIEHFESVAIVSFTPGLQCLTAIRSATSSALLMVFSMPCPYAIYIFCLWDSSGESIDNNWELPYFGGGFLDALRASPRRPLLEMRNLEAPSLRASPRRGLS